MKFARPNLNEIGSHIRPQDAEISSKSDDFCRAMLCKRGLCCHAVCVCLSDTFVHSVKTNNIFSIFLPSGSHTILVCQYQTAWRYSDGTPLTGASNAGGVGKTPDSERISGLTAC